MHARSNKIALQINIRQTAKIESALLEGQRTVHWVNLAHWMALGLMGSRPGAIGSKKMQAHVSDFCGVRLSVWQW